jgi:hypothetical protein
MVTWHFDKGGTMNRQKKQPGCIQKLFTLGCLTVIGLVVLAIASTYIGVESVPDGKSPLARPSEQTFSDGDTASPQVGLGRPTSEVGSPVRLYVEGATWVFLATTKEAIAAMVDAQNAGDFDELRRLAEQQEVFMVANNTDAKVIDRTLGMTRVRITEPNKVYSDREGWIQRECVRAMSQDDKPSNQLPAYRILDKVGNSIDVLVPDIDTNTSQDNLTATARAIADRENVREVALYRTEAAFRANVSASFAREHPTAMADGYLGRWDNGTFYPSGY